MMRFEETPNARLVFFTDSKIVEESHIRKISDELNEHIGSICQGKRLVLDFNGVQFMTSAMLGRLVLVRKAAAAASVELKLRNICPPMFTVFRVTSLNRVFSIGEGSFGEEPLVSSVPLENTLNTNAVKVA